jgi:type I restriction enzyme S subunit
MSEWKEYKLRDLTSKIGSGATPRGGSNAYIASGISLIRSQNVLDFKFSESGLAFIDDDQANELKNVIIAENDILLNITGDSVARCCIVPSKYLPARVNQHVSIVRPIPEKADFKFVFYYLQYIKPELLINAEIGATRNAITKGMIEEIEISLPEIKEQRAIASVLSSLDDKIDLLHHQNATLESMAQTLFRQWFVEEAKEEWVEYKVANIAEHLKVNIIPSKMSSSLFHHYSLPAFDEGQNPVVELGADILSNKYKVFPESILVSKLNPKSPRIWAIGSDINENSICSTEFQLFKPKDHRYFAYLFFLLKSNNARNALIMAASGTSGSHQRASPEDISNIPFALPNFDLAIDFSKIVQPSLNKMNQNKTQIHTLTALRDTLLPKLMSGEVRVEIINL